MELSIKTVVTSTLIIIVLVLLSFFISTETSEQGSRAEINRIFSSMCQEYRIQDCDWSVTKDASFGEFLSACRSLYGSESEAYSCLYVSCPACRKIEIDAAKRADELRCASLCEQCTGDSEIGVRSICCQQFMSQCTASGVDCRAACP